MRSWQIIVASVAAASLAVGIVFLPDALQFRTDPALLFLVYWPAFAILWLGAYAIATLLLSTVATLREIGSIAAGLVGQAWARRHLVRLEVTQYFTAVLALFVLKPMRARVMESNAAETAMPSSSRPAVTLAE